MSRQLVPYTAASNTNNTIEIVVLGKARHGKSFLGNKLHNRQNISQRTTEKPFKTSAGTDSCTQEIQSVPFKGLKHKLDETSGSNERREYDITYTDTPGFPDTEGPKRSIEVYNDIVKHINDKKPAALVWLLNPSRNKDDMKLFQNYSFLMKKFANKGVFCAILANYQGDSDMDQEEEAQTIQEVLKTVDEYKLLGNFVDREDHIFISPSSKRLVNVFLQIVDRASTHCNMFRSSVSKFETFEEICDYYFGAFDEVEARRRAVNEKEAELVNLEAEKASLNQTITSLGRKKRATKATAVVAGGAFLIVTGGTAAAAAILLAEFGAGVAAVAGAAVGAVEAAPAAGVYGAAGSMTFGIGSLITRYNDKLNEVEETLSQVKCEIENLTKNDDAVKVHHDKLKKEFVTILNAMGCSQNVRILDNESEPELSGKTGTILMQIESTGLYYIFVPDPKRTVSLKVDNFEVLSD